MLKSLRLRLIVAAVVWVAAALIVTGIVISSLLHDFVERSFESRLAATLVAVMGTITFDEERRLRLLAKPVAEPHFDLILSGWYWQVADGKQVLIGSRSLWNYDLGVAAGPTPGAQQKAIILSPNGEVLHALWRDFSVPETDATLRVTVTAPRAEINAALNGIVPPIVWSLAILGLGLLVAVLLQVHFGLRPLDQVRRNLAAIRQGRLERLPDEAQIEISPLIREINALISHNKEVIERTRTHVRNLAHRMKTPLAVLSNEMSRRGRDPEGVMAECIEMMQRQIQYHLRRARTAASREVAHARIAAGPVVEDVVSAMRGLHRSRNLRMQVIAQGQPLFAGEKQDLEEMLGNLIDNACKWATSRVVVNCTSESDSMVITISDDGPGMASNPSKKSDVDAAALADQPPTSAGFGLAIVEEIAQLYGGSVDFGRSDMGGLEVTLRLPGRSGNLEVSEASHSPSHELP